MRVGGKFVNAGARAAVHERVVRSEGICVVLGCRDLWREISALNIIMSVWGGRSLKSWAG